MDFTGPIPCEELARLRSAAGREHAKAVRHLKSCVFIVQFYEGAVCSVFGRDKFLQQVQQ